MGTVEYPFNIAEGCVLDSISQVQILLDAGADGTIDQDLTTTGALSGTYPNYRINGVFPIGNHRFEVIVTDGCGNEGAALLPFSVVDCYVPDPHCQSGLIVNLQALPPNTDINGDGKIDVAAVTVQASDLATYQKMYHMWSAVFWSRVPGSLSKRTQKSVIIETKGCAASRAPALSLRFTVSLTSTMMRALSRYLIRSFVVMMITKTYWPQQVSHKSK